MSIGGCIRRNIYWAKDLFKEDSMYFTYRTIKKINAEKNKENEQTVNNTIQELLKHAIDTTAFYSQCECRLESFPVINKQTIINNRQEMLSDMFKNEKLHEMHTSGSTGIPFVVQQNRGKRKRVIAEIKAMNDLAGYSSHEKMLYILGVSKNSPYSRRQQFSENIYRIGVAVNDDETMKKLYDFIIKKKPVAIHASASNLPPLIEYIRKNSLDKQRFSVKTIITGGEMVPDELCSDLRSVFGEECIIAIKYSNEEMGIIGQAIGRSDEYILNAADYYVEILKMDSDEPCKSGEQGRIVVTDLFNRALPMIRYDTGDIGAVIQSEGRWPKLVELSGKRRDLLYDTRGNSISGPAVTNMMKYVTGVKLWQIVQEAEKRYIYKIVPNKDNLTNEDIKLDELKGLLGHDAEVVVEITDEIPTVKSGKRRYTVQLYRPY